MRVAIIGAGLAGLTLASRLSQAGLEVEVFEKSRGLGGRLATKRLDWGHINLGAQYFTARDPRFIDQVAQWQQQGAVKQWVFEPHLWRDGVLKASPDKTQRFVGVPSMNAIAHALAQDLVIHRSTRVTSIRFNGNSHTLLAENSDQFAAFDFVVLSCPAEQTRVLLQDSVGTLATSLLFKQIPERVHAPCWAAALVTNGKVCDGIGGIFGDDVVAWVSRLSQLPQQQAFDGYDDLWMLHFASEWSRDNDTNHSVKPESIAAQGFAWLSDVLKSNRYSGFKLVNHYCHYWRYARIDETSTNSTKASSAVMIDRDNQVAIIGDWCQGGRVEGAYLSALELADQLL